MSLSVEIPGNIALQIGEGEVGQLTPHHWPSPEAERVVRVALADEPGRDQLRVTFT
jgi:hypothetical protein